MTRVHLVLHPFQLQGTKPYFRCLSKTDFELVLHILSCGTHLKLSNKVVVHAIQHSEACSSILLRPVLVGLQPFLILDSRSINRLAIFVLVRRRKFSYRQVFKLVSFIQKILNLLLPHVIGRPI